MAPVHLTCILAASLIMLSKPRFMFSLATTSWLSLRLPFLNSRTWTNRRWCLPDFLHVVFLIFILRVPCAEVANSASVPPIRESEEPLVCCWHVWLLLPQSQQIQGHCALLQHWVPWSEPASNSIGYISDKSIEIMPTHQSISQFFGHFVHDWMDSKWMHSILLDFGNSIDKNMQWAARILLISLLAYVLT